MKGYKIKTYLLSAAVLALFSSCASTTPTTSTKPTTVKSETTKAPAAVPATKNVRVNLPNIPREFRAVWVASVANINWPSKNNLTTEQQKAEAINILETLVNNNFNAVILQIRPSADALYKSNLEPWSYFLTGSIGKAPSPYYDPLQFWVEEAHKRNIELHVWLNPFRAHHTGGGAVTSESMVKKSPDNVVKLKNGMYWFDPSNPKTQDHVSNVVKDIVKRYDIDGVHFDDYFYPYASYNGGADFPDQKTWNEYQRVGGNLSRADWRRANVNKFVERIYKEIKAEKNYVKFGISPFGIWKPGYPAGVTGSSQYDELYADAKLWLNEGWIDYFSPQLYWSIASKGQSFPSLLKWWNSENTKKRHLWPGLNTVEIKAADRASEIVNQIEVTRSIIKDNPGVIHYSLAGLTKNASMLPKLKYGPYKEPALLPSTPWLKTEKLAKPNLTVDHQAATVVASWRSAKGELVKKWIVYSKYGEKWNYEILHASINKKSFPTTQQGQKLTMLAVKALDRLDNESDYEAVEVN